MLLSYKPLHLEAQRHLQEEGCVVDINGPQEGKSGDPRSQDIDSSPRAQGTLGLGFEAKPKGKCGAPRALTACGLVRRVAIDGPWASLLPHAASATVQLDETLLHAERITLRAIMEADGWPPSAYK